MTEALDLTTPAGRAMAGLLAVFSQFEREIPGERVGAGLDHARRQGKRLGRPPAAVARAGSVRDLSERILELRRLADKYAPHRRSADLESAGDLRFADSCEK